MPSCTYCDSWFSEEDDHRCPNSYIHITNNELENNRKSIARSFGYAISKMANIPIGDCCFNDNDGEQSISIEYTNKNKYLEIVMHVPESPNHKFGKKTYYYYFSDNLTGNYGILYNPTSGDLKSAFDWFLNKTNEIGKGID